MNPQEPTKLMIVDDDMDTRLLAKVVAQSEGIFISIKKGGLSALSELHAFNYDIDAVIIDLSMPDMDGITLTKQIRQNENLRSKRTLMKVYWFTGWPFDPKNANDPIVLGAKEARVEKIYSKAVDLPTIVREVKERLESVRRIT